MSPEDAPVSGEQRVAIAQIFHTRSAFAKSELRYGPAWHALSTARVIASAGSLDRALATQGAVDAAGEMHHDEAGKFFVGESYAYACGHNDLLRILRAVGDTE